MVSSPVSRFPAFFGGILLLLMMIGCEFSLHEDNFVEVPYPTDYPTVNISFNGGSDTIRISKVTQLNYKLLVENEQDVYGIFRLQNQTWRIYSDSGNFIIDPSLLEDAIDSLTLEVYVPTHSGSLASNLENEFYILTRKWIVIVDDAIPAPITACLSNTPEGYLKVTWLMSGHLNFSKYTLNISSVNGGMGRTLDILDRNQHYYIDSCYIGGHCSYAVRTQVYGYYNQDFGTPAVADEPKPQLNFVETSPDSIRISWNRLRQHAKYTLTEQYPELLLADTRDTSITVAAPGFGNWKTYMIVASPLCSSCGTEYNLMNTESYGLGTYILPNWPAYSYNRADNMVYSNRYEYVIGYDAATQDTTGYSHLNGVLYGGLSSCPTNSSAMAITTMDQIAVYSDKSLQNPVLIPYPSADYLDHIQFCDNNTIATARTGVYEQIDLSSQQVKLTMSIADYPVYSKWACISTSRLAEYVSVVTKNGGSLYRISNDYPIPEYSDNRCYRSSYFNPDHDELLQTFFGNNVLEFRDPNGYNLIRTLNLPAPDLVICNIDPVTGHLLLRDYTDLYIIDLATGSTVLKLKSSDGRPKLYGNFIYGNCGRTFNIQKFLKK